MANKTNNSKKITLILLIVVVVTISFVVYNKVGNKINKETKIEEKSKDSKNKVEEVENTTKTEQDKNQAENNSTAGDGKEQSKDANSKPSDTKQTEEKTTDKSDAGEEITASVQEANFGCTVEISINISSSNSYKYYQFYADNKPISKVESIEKNRTTLYPAQESGSEVKVKIFDENKKEIKTLDIKLNAK